MLSFFSLHRGFGRWCRRACKSGRSLSFLKRLPKTLWDNPGTAHDLLPDVHGGVHIPRLLVSFGKGLLGFFGVSTRLTGFLSITGSSILFGLVHFIPAFCCLRGKSIWIPLYALIMPTTLGMVFCVLTRYHVRFGQGGSSISA